MEGNCTRRAGNLPIDPFSSYGRTMKSHVLLFALALSLAGCAEISPHADQANTGIAIFQADTAQTPDHIAQCVEDAYRGRGDIKFIELPTGGKEMDANLANGAVVEVIQFRPTTEGTHVEVHQMTTERRDPDNFVKQARVCGAMSGS